MNNEAKVIKVLRDIATKSKLAGAAFYLFALRIRTRQQLTVRSFMLRMKKEGFIFDKKDYIEFIHLLADLHLGDIERTSRGKVKGLKDIQFTLQSIGKAAVGKSEYLIPVKRKKKLLELATNEMPFVPGLKFKTKLGISKIKLLVTVDGINWILEVPKEYSEEDLAKVICFLNNN